MSRVSGVSGVTGVEEERGVEQERGLIAARIREVLAGPARPVALRGARKVDASGVTEGFWLVTSGERIEACGVADGAHGGVDGGVTAFDMACIEYGVAPSDILDVSGFILVPGYVDIHAHGAWGAAFDDGVDGIEMARAGHMMHGTTRQVLSLITNPVDTLCENLATVRGLMGSRSDILGSHLEGPFLALARKGAHDPECLKDPEPELVEQLLEAANGSLKQITIAPELPHGLSAIRQFAAAGVVPAVGHCDADYAMAGRGFDAGARIMTHMFNAMNGLHHRKPGPIPAAAEDPRVIIELINDGFHVDNAMLKLGLGFAPHRIAFVTDAMSATDCPDGHYLLGALDVNVEDGHARLVSNGAIAGSTLTLEKAVQRAVVELGMAPTDAVEAATLTPARALGFEKANAVTEYPLGLLASGYAADFNLLDADTWAVRSVWCAGRRVK
ncbi:N-acetylglucosamine-6-phosphate deacetylase [Alloscardovia macacae]|uniref:N-acetylglucosamine-6-phosphate deacetylase n=1 Tax=Alloscardovia macacae TaxID=1160091 RepID=A0A261F3K1_9BIFI|nr:N-acetylglucosamine-6-phosphate deacetylase [Alloscardovia macacae]